MFRLRLCVGSVATTVRQLRVSLRRRVSVVFLPHFKRKAHSLATFPLLHRIMSSQQYVNELRFGLSAAEITKLKDGIIKYTKKVYDEVAAIPDGEHTFENTVKALAEEDAVTSVMTNNVTFPMYVSTDKEIRNAAAEANKELEAFGIECAMREDVYKSVLKYKEALARSAQTLDPEDQRLLDKTIEGFERNGLGLPPEQREKLKHIKTAISEKEIQFQKNLNEESTILEFTREELDGLPSDFIENLPKVEVAGVVRYKVSLKYPDLFPIMKLAKNENTRKRLDVANSSKCPENVPLLEETLRLRQEAAKLLGFETHADYVLAIRMAKSAKRALEFLSDLRAKLVPLGLAERDKLLDLKKAEKGEQHFDGQLHSHDFRYYHNMLLAKEYEVDDQLIKEYFPMDFVTRNMLDLYQRLLSLRFEEVPHGIAHVWHDDVKMFAVFDDETGELMGHFYLDLFPRDGKYTHAAAFPLQPTYRRPDGSRRPAASAMVANFTKPTADKPSLLMHDEVVTYFHEFGHVMHSICSRARYSRFAGTAVERDFVEAPSQMLENWCWEPAVLRTLSGHYLDTAKPLPEDVLQKMVAAKNADTGLLNLRQIFFATFDLICHTTGTDSTEKLWEKLKEEISLVGHCKGTNPAGSFGHLMGGYDAQYYGYLYSEVFSADMFSRFKAEGVLNPTVGKQYREIVLAPGGSVDSEQSLRKFLGREPNQEAFLEHIGVTKAMRH